MAAVERDLVEDGLVMRYRSEESGGWLAGEAKAFSCRAPSGWPIACSSRVARRKRASFLKRLLALRNDVGLVVEEYDPKEKRLLGNFPQAFTHVG